MDPKGKNLADLATELLRRGAGVDDVFNVINAASSAENGRATSVDKGLRADGKPRQRNNYVTHETFLAALGEAGRPITRVELMERTGLRGDSITRHVERGIQLGTVMKIGKTEPFHYQLARSGARRTEQTESSSTEGPRYQFAFMDVVRGLAALGNGKSIREIHEKLGGTDQAIRMHLTKAFERKLVVRHATSPITFSVAKGVDLSPAVEKKRRFGLGAKNNELIIRALTKAGKPLDAAGFIAMEPGIRAMEKGAVYMALSKASRHGIIQRISPGIYNLPAKGKPAPKASKPEAPASEPKNDASAQLSMVN